MIGIFYFKVELKNGSVLRAKMTIAVAVPVFDSNVLEANNRANEALMENIQDSLAAQQELPGRHRVIYSEGPCNDLVAKCERFRTMDDETVGMLCAEDQPDIVV